MSRKLAKSNIVELENGNIKLIAEEGFVIRSKDFYLDEEKETFVPNIEGTLIYLGINDSADNYVKAKEGEELVLTEEQKKEIEELKVRKQNEENAEVIDNQDFVAPVEE